jgi:hypothetical protein
MKTHPGRFIAVWLLASFLNLCGNGIFMLLEFGHVMSAFSNPNFTYVSPFQTEYNIWDCGYIAAKNIYERYAPDPGPKLGQTMPTTPELDLKIQHHQHVLTALFFVWIVVVGFLSAVVVEAAISLSRAIFPA